MNTATVALKNYSPEYTKFSLKDAVSEAIDSANSNQEKIKTPQTITLEREVALEISKSLLSSFSPEMVEICESDHCMKLTAQIKNVSKLAEGQVGTRSLYLSKYGKRLNGFEFNNNAPFKKTFQAKHYIKQGSRRDQLIIHFPAFVPDKVLKRSNKATNFKISTRMVALSDVRYEYTDEKCIPLNGKLHGKFVSHDSAMLPILKMPMDSMTSQLCLNQPLFPESASLFLIMSISFYSYAHGQFVHLKNDGCVQIKKVF